MAGVENIHLFDQRLAAIDQYLDDSLVAWMAELPENNDFTVDICLLAKALGEMPASLIADTLAVAMYRLLKMSME